MVPEATLKDGGTGLVPASEGWFVMSALDGRWFVTPGKGMGIPLTGDDEYEAETFFPMLGMAIRVVPAGEPSTTYHWETEQEDFLVLDGEGLLIVEGQERPAAEVGLHPAVRRGRSTPSSAARSSSSARARASSRKTGRGGYYCADETAAKYNAASPEDTQDGRIAYARFPPPMETRYPGGLPSG